MLPSLLFISTAACAEEAERQLIESGGGKGAWKRRKVDCDSPAAAEDSQQTEDDLGYGGGESQHTIIVEDEEDAYDGFK